MIAEFRFRGFIVFSNHYWMHLRWIYLALPEHLHGAIRGLSNSPSSRQIRQISLSSISGLNPSELYFVMLLYTLNFALTSGIYSVYRSSRIISLTFIFIFPILSKSPSFNLYFCEGVLFTTSHSWLLGTFVAIKIGARTYCSSFF